MSSIIEAKAVISAEDRTGRTFDAIAKKFGQLGRGAKISAEVDRMAKSISRAESAMRAIDAVQSRRGGFTAAREKFRQTQAAVESAARALKSAEKPTRELEANLSRAQRAVTSASRAFENQKRIMLDATRAATGLGVPVNKIASEQARLKSSIDATSAALGRQIKMERRVAEVRDLTRSRRTESAVAARATAERMSRGGSRVHASGGGRGIGRELIDNAVGGYVGAHAAAHVAHRVQESYTEFDTEIRRQTAMADLNPEEKESRIRQAVRLGGSTPYNDNQVLHAQRTLAGRGVRKDLVEPFIEEIVNYAQAMNTDLPAAAKTLEGIVFSTNQHVDDAKTATTVMRRNVDLAVKMAKIGGLEDHDVAQAFKMGGATASGAGLSNETMATLFALLRRSGYSGEEAGTAARGISSKLIAPDRKGLLALDAMGVNYSSFVRMPDALNVDRLDTASKRLLGKSLNAGQKGRLGTVMSDPEAILDRDKFIADATGIIGETFGRNKKGELKANDAKTIAKVVGDFYKMAAESVDTEGLLRAVISAHPTQAQSNALFTREHGGKFGSIANKPELFDEYNDKLKHTPEGFAKGIGDTVMGGFAGAWKRLQGSLMNVYTATGRAVDPYVTPGLNLAGQALQHAAELPGDTLAFGAAIGTATSALMSFKGAVAASTAADAVFGVGGGLSASAAGGGLLGGLATMSVPAFVGYGALAYGGMRVAGAAGDAALKVGGIIGGKYWQPKSAQDVDDLQRQKTEAQGQIDGIESRVHPSMRGNPNPELDRLRGIVADLENRIASGPLTLARALPNSTPISSVATAAFGPLGPRGMSMPWDGPSAVLPPVRPGSSPIPPSFATGADLSGKLEATVKPDQIQANVKPDQITAKIDGSISATIRVEGPGQVVNTTTSGAVRSAGTSMLPRTGSGFVRGGV